MRIVLFLLMLFLAPSNAKVTDNLRWSIDASARFNNNIAADNKSAIYALGLDTHKVFTASDGDIGYAVGQLYFTKLSNQTPVPWLFDSEDDSRLIIREAHVNYTDTPIWMPNVRLGHFTLPFGLEESIDTNGRLLDYHHGKNLGTKLDWGLGLNKVLKHVEYNVSYTLGGKDKAKSIDGSYAVTGRIGTLSHHNFVFGLSLLQAKIDQVTRKRASIDWQYYYGTWGVLGEIALGEEKQQESAWQSEQYYLLELNKTAISEQLKVYGQLVITDKEKAVNTEKIMNIGASYQINGQLEFSLSSRKQISSPESSVKQDLFRAQLRYRF